MAEADRIGGVVMVPGEDVPELEVAATFDGLFVTEYPKMVALAAAVSGSRAHAEDIAQEAMSRLNRHWDKVRNYAEPGAWVRRVTINLALSQRRKLMNETRALLRLERSKPELPPPPEDDERVWEAVTRLPKQQRAVVALYFLEDRAIEDIAGILEVAPSTARVHLHRARQALRDDLGRQS